MIPISIRNELIPPPDAILEVKQTRLALARAMDTITPREERVLRLRYGLGNSSEHTYAEIGVQLNVCAARANQIAAKALRKLRHPSRKLIFDGIANNYRRATRIIAEDLKFSEGMKAAMVEKSTLSRAEPPRVAQTDVARTVHVLSLTSLENYYSQLPPQTDDIFGVILRNIANNKSIKPPNVITKAECFKLANSLSDEQLFTWREVDMQVIDRIRAVARYLAGATAFA